MHLYWGRDKPLSWLRWLTVATFSLHNPDWRIIVWHPQDIGASPTWRTMEHGHCCYTGEDWFPRLKEAGPNVSLRRAAIKDFPRMTEVHRSDLYRWRLLHEMGGFWSDFDIIYFRPMKHLRLDMTADALLCWGEVPDLLKWQAIGFLGGKQGAQLFQGMENIGLKLAHALDDKLKYQDLGTDLLVRFAPPGETRAAGSTIAQIPQHAVYPFERVHTQPVALWEDSSLLHVTRDTIGVHWFAAQKQSCLKEAEWTSVNKVRADECMGGVRWALFKAGFDVGSQSITINPTLHVPVKYSLIMPYYKRSTQLRSTLMSLERIYPQRHDYEVILINDAKCAVVNQENYLLKNLIKEFSPKINIRVVQGGSLDSWNPAAAFNQGVEMANGDYMIITNPECVHRSNVLGGLDEEFAKNPNCYVVCSCFAIKETDLNPGDKLPPGHWYQHSQYRNVEVHFCSALSRETYEAIGGFDEEYAKGMGFDDDDFRQRLRRAKVPFVHRDDLVVIHLAHPNNKPHNYLELHTKNKKYYASIWGDEAPPAEKLRLGPMKEYQP
jgi:GT2 family glycosyltransferase